VRTPQQPLTPGIIDAFGPVHTLGDAGQLTLRNLYAAVNSQKKRIKATKKSARIRNLSDPGAFLPFLSAMYTPSMAAKATAFRE
jgi:hypothetical protein